MGSLEGLAKTRAAEGRHLRDLTSRLAALVERVEREERQGGGLRSRLEQLRQEQQVSQQEVTVTCYAGERDRLEARRQELEEKVAPMQEQVQGLRQENQEIKEVIAKKNFALEQGSRSARRLRSRAQELRSRVEQEEHAVVGRRQELERIQGVLEKESRRLEERHGEVERVRQEVDRLQEVQEDRAERRRGLVATVEEQLSEEQQSQEVPVLQPPDPQASPPLLQACLLSLSLSYTAQQASLLDQYNNPFLDCLHVAGALLLRERVLARVKTDLLGQARGRQGRLGERLARLQGEQERLHQQLARRQEQLERGVEDLVKELGKDEDILLLHRKLCERRSELVEQKHQEKVLELEVGLYRRLLEEGERGVVRE